MKAAEMVNTGEWVIMSATFREGKLFWVLLRVQTAEEREKEK
jgi:hypothetical protein